ncbi:SRPBCC family protein [Paenibacillus mucilaginosus]|uniref:Activator of Hsp90 ATPase 1 family protein n=1 Tax=Paenibacillus mucilaginosus (strain KNP414) TaxID=1036673 RepID=F8FL65_PAEMK|nr:SRPBCC domain-containing protein [Paenibacillus mucilaginosus]AEI39984.1 Activator of Hsp90 ATPase 1 family protein [Paenibacillus mucilaginosus KNP414]MCG7216405.1 SRPBCC domain-containing protein [Paenibacillus mucilaginosus]WDM29239.1 SRPBCC domain-containing protein [Paenibacillus mucilaginosus]
MSHIVDLIITRTIQAPREIVFQAFTQAEHLKHWWGPKGWVMDVSQIEVRPGGICHYRLQSAEGHVMWAKFVYSEISTPEKLVYISSFSDEDGRTVRAPFSPAFPLEVRNTLTLTELDGRTTFTLHGEPVSATEEEHEFFRSMHESMQMGFGGTFDQLAEYLASKR